MTSWVPRVLVIDDDRAIQADFRKVLCPPPSAEALGEAEAALFGEAASEPAAGPEFAVDVADQGQLGHEMVRDAVSAESPYSVAFVDMRMPPGWDGLETIEHLWASDPRLQVVICTAFSDHSWQDVSGRLGRTDNLLILKKPVDAAEVRQMALSLSEKWRLRERARRELLESERLSRELKVTNQNLEREINVRRVAEEELRTATLDQLTGLANRRSMLECVRSCLDRQRRDPDYQFAVMFLDIDNFKLVNDNLGHTAGDELLVEVAARLRECIQALGADSICTGETIARIGGDEFVIVLDRIRQQTDYPRIAQTVLDRIGSVCRVGPQRTGLTLGASIGIAAGGPGHQEAEDLVRDADTAMYRAKTAGKARFAIFDPEMHRATRLRLSIENDLRRALAMNELRVVFQPIVRLPECTLRGFEALLRWDRSNADGRIAPQTFIPVAEESGLIIPIGHWVLDTVVKTLCEWRTQLRDLSGFSVSVNVSRRELLHPMFVEGVRATLARYDFPRDMLKLEVTESGVIEDFALASRHLNALRDLGIGLFMDDFGTGYSSLSCLHRLPFDLVKVDRSFTAEMRTNADYSAVIQAIVSLARTLGKEVLIEGVETEEQLDLITELGCNFAQGFLFSRPVSADQATMMLREGSSQGMFTRTALSSRRG